MTHAYTGASCSIAARLGHGLNSLTLTTATRAVGPRPNVIRPVDTRATGLFLTVVVEPSCQGLGLGRAVMERLVRDLRRDGVCNIVLYAGPRVVGFYRLLDFAMDPDGIRGMAYYRKSSSTS
jgi:GNAT superfamily N-acetyltransferase